MKTQLKKIEWEEEKSLTGINKFSYVRGSHPIAELNITCRNDMPEDQRLHRAYIDDEYLDGYSSIEAAKKACQDELDRIVMSCIEPEYGDLLMEDMPTPAYAQGTRMSDVVRMLEEENTWEDTR